MGIEMDLTTLSWTANPSVSKKAEPWHLTAEPRVRSKVSPCDSCDGKIGIGTGSSPSTSVFSCQLSFHQCSVTWAYPKDKYMKSGYLPNNFRKSGGGGAGGGKEPQKKKFLSPPPPPPKFDDFTQEESEQKHHFRFCDHPPEVTPANSSTRQIGRPIWQFHLHPTTQMRHNLTSWMFTTRVSNVSLRRSHWNIQSLNFIVAPSTAT